MFPKNKFFNSLNIEIQNVGILFLCKSKILLYFLIFFFLNFLTLLEYMFVLVPAIVVDVLGVCACPFLFEQKNNVCYNPPCL